MPNVLSTYTWLIGMAFGLSGIAAGGVWAIQQADGDASTEVGPRPSAPATAERPATADADTYGLPPGDAERRYKVPVTGTQPSLGPDDALVTVVYWNGFLDPDVRAAEAVLQQTLRAYGDEARLVHRALPESDRQISLYVFAQGAQSQAGKFWEVREAMLGLPKHIVPGPQDLEPIARAHGVDLQQILSNTHPYLLHVQVDARLGKQFGVEEATLFVNGRRLLLGDPATLRSRLVELVDVERDRASSQVGAGVSRAKLYDHTVQDGYWAVNDDPELRKQRAAQNVNP